MAVLQRSKTTVFGLVTDLTNIATATGLNADLTYSQAAGANYIAAATSVKGSDILLDAAIKAANDAIGAVASLTTTSKVVVGAINELDAKQGNDVLTTTASTLTAAVNELDASQGNDVLTTTASTLTAAVNELDASQGNDALTTVAVTLTAAVNELDAKQGAAVLTTTATDLSAAVNELDLKQGSIALTTTATDISAAVNELDAEIGNMGVVTTTATTVSGAINEFDAEIGDLTTKAATLNATTLIGMVNELESDKMEKTSNLSDLTDLVVARSNLQVDSSAEVDNKITTAGLNLGTNLSTQDAASAATDFGIGSLSVGDNIFLSDDGDTKWAIYKVITVTDGAFDTSTTVKIMDEDVFLNAVSAASIKASYESNADTNAYTDEDLARVARIGASATALTTTATEVFAAINELDLLQGDVTLSTTAQTVTGGISELDAEIGVVSTLTTTASTVVPAINELDALQGNVVLTTTATTLTAAINEHDLEIGNVGTLTTAASTVVPAINELDALQGNVVLTTTAQTVTGGISELDAEIGALTNRAITLTGTTLIGMINELEAEKLEKSANLSDVADVTTARANLDVMSSGEIATAIANGGAEGITESVAVALDKILLTHAPKNDLIVNFATVRHIDANFVSYDIPVTKDVADATGKTYLLSPDSAGQFDGKSVTVQYFYIATAQ